ncbi:MAG: succinylglutamate desuccinylase/aspartoacylase family protein [Candidatus Eremiobacteraeota bacterium]|nr:succinylglutamate desuccinylase/aspartoacylase family protein [Candidatus Eremiobacteraeota bacterium]
MGCARTLLAAEVGDVRLPCIMLAAGTHGNEPAASWALLNIVESGLLHPAFSYRMWPCINPSGYELETRSNAEGSDINRSFSGGGTTPEAKAIITSNRDRRFFASFDLHEDPEAAGFYCFEPARPDQPLLGDQVIKAIDEAGFPLQTLSAEFDLGYEQDVMPNARLEQGRVLLDLASELQYFQERGLPFTAYMLRRASRCGLTFEAPGTRSWDERISVQRVAIVRALSELAKVSSAQPPN